MGVLEAQVVPNELPSNVLDGLVVASGSREAVCDARLVNSLRAYVQQFDLSVDVAPFVPGGAATERVGALLLVWCEGGAARRITVWTVACDYLRAHATEFEIEILEASCQRLGDALGLQSADEVTHLPG